MPNLNRPPKEDEAIYVSHTQVFARVIEVGSIMRRGANGDGPVWRVLAERKGHSAEIDVSRSGNGRLHVCKGGVLREAARWNQKGG